MKELVRHCLRVDPGERPANAGEVAVALNAYFEERDQRLRQVKAEQEKAQLRIEEERKRRRIAMGLVAVLLAGIAGTVWGLSRTNVEWQRAEQNAATSERNAQAASKNAQMATEKALLAEQVVKNFYTRIGQEKLFDTPSLQPLRQELLDEALKLYVQATREAPDDLPLRLAHGQLLLNSAAVTFSRGEAASALQLVEQATDKLQNVLDSSAGAAPELPSQTRSGWTLASQARQYLGRARMYEGIARMRIGRPSECIQLFEQAGEFYQSLAADHPQDIHTRRIKAELYSAWGFLLTVSPTPEAALPLLNQALELWLLITALESHNEYDRHDLARNYWDIGYCQRMMSANSVGESWEQLLAHAIDNYQRSIEILEPLSKEYPGSMAFQTTLGEVYSTLAVAYSYRNDRGALSTEERAENNRLAIEAHQQALAAHTRLVAQNPGIEQLEFNLSRSYMNYGVQLKISSISTCPVCEPLLTVSLQPRWRKGPHAAGWQPTLHSNGDNNAMDQSTETLDEPWSDLARLLESGESKALEPWLAGQAHHDLPLIVSRLNDAQRIQLIDQLPPEDVAAIVDHMPSDQQADLLTELADDDAEAIL